MRKLSDTFAELAALGGTGAARTADRLRDMDAFGDNPGALRARVYVPEHVSERPALVVVLHGCTQTAAAYDIGSGWSRLADRLGFVLLFPEQARSNNPNVCFNWFVPKHVRRGSGEVASIRAMIATLVDDRAIDPTRIFVTGLSAGGGMAAAMLAAYPEVFAGGAIIAGLPYGTAVNVPQALDRMRGQGGPAAAELSQIVRRASPHDGPWPTLSIWQGTADSTVNPANADALLAQWRPLHGVAAAPSAVEIVDGYPRRVWRDAAGRDVIEDYRITGMGHGTPIDTRGAEACGVAGPFMLDARISSTERIAAFWGLSDEVDQAAEDEAAAEQTALPALQAKRAERLSPEAPAKPAVVVDRVGKIIEDALRAAGLMR